MIASPMRIAALHRLELLDTPAEPIFDRLTRMAARLLKVPLALISLVDEDRQFCKSAFGLVESLASRRESRLTGALCQQTVALGLPVIVADVRDHPELQQHIGTANLYQAYVGIPLLTPDGFAIGALCLADYASRVWTSDEVETLQDIAGVVMAEIAVRFEAAERKRTEQVGRRLAGRSARLLEGQRTFFELLATGAPLGLVLKALAHMLDTQLRDGMCAIQLLEDDGQHLRLGAAPGLPDAYQHAIDRAPIGPHAGSSGAAVFFGEPVIADDILTDPHWIDDRKLALTHHLRACWSIPFRDSQQAVLGVCAIYCRAARAPSVAELEQLNHTSHLAAIAVDRHRIEQDHERLIAQLRDALASVKTLRGLLPICSSCKKIRDDKGYWNQLETYLQAHSEADFTHGLCPDCAHRLYGEHA